MNLTEMETSAGVGNFTIPQKLKIVPAENITEPKKKSKKKKQTFNFKEEVERCLSSMEESFKTVAAGIAKRKGIPIKNASAILASATRKASAKAKKKNPNLKKVRSIDTEKEELWS
jgi:hypothetical protein